LRQPERADEPRIAGTPADVAANLMVVIVLVPGQAADVRIDPKARTNRLHGADDPRIVCIVHPKEKETGHTRVETPVDRIPRAIWSASNHPDKAVFLRLPEVLVS